MESVSARHADLGALYHGWRCDVRRNRILALGSANTRLYEGAFSLHALLTHNIKSYAPSHIALVGSTQSGGQILNVEKISSIKGWSIQPLDKFAI